MKDINILRLNIENYFPALIKILGENNLDWDNINNIFEKEHSKRIERFNEQSSPTISIEATIYDIIVEVKKNNKQAIGLLDFFNKLMIELDLNLTEGEKKLILPTIRSILTALDKRYLDFTAELAVLNNLIKSKTYRLDAVETELANKKTIDFTLNRIIDNKLMFVEIVSIHLNSERINSDENLIRKFLTDRLTQKINNKKNKLVDNVDFFLIPVLWGGWKDIKIYSDYFQKNTMHLENVIEPVSYLTFTDPNDETFHLHRFGNVSNLFKTE